MNYHSGTTPANHDQVLDALALAVDITPTKRQEAVDRYKSLGEYLDRDGSPIKGFKPLISPQGSFLLDLVNRPWNDAEEYDLDLVCRLTASTSHLSQATLKKMVAAEVAGYAKAHGMEEPEDHRRCCRLNYAESALFHMDILPAIPDAARYRQMLSEGGYRDLAGSEELSGHAIAITDKTHPHYQVIAPDWYRSNPSGYAAWFRSRMEVQLRARRQLLERRLITASVDDVPDPQLKTPLQRAIQLLKRHRDFMFRNDPEHKPISIIITTLAAQSYNNEPTTSAALEVILRNMESHIKERHGVRWVANPVNPAENFADKWAETTVKESNFRRWLGAAQRDFGMYLQGSPYRQLPQGLLAAFGARAVRDAMGDQPPLAAPAVKRPEEQVRAAAEVAKTTHRPSPPWQVE